MAQTYIDRQKDVWNSTQYLPAVWCTERQRQTHPDTHTTEQCGVQRDRGTERQTIDSRNQGIGNAIT